MRATHTVLCVDDEEANLITLRYILDDVIAVDTTTKPDEALQLLAQNSYTLLISDQRMPGMTGTELCARAKEVAPRVVRFILTAFADLHSTLDAVNRGHVSKYLTKPIRDDVLLRAVQDAITVHETQESIREMQHALLSDRGATLVREAEARVAKNVSGPLGAIERSAEHLRDLCLAISTCSQDDLPRLQNDVKLSVDAMLTDIAKLRSLGRSLERGQSDPQVSIARVDAVLRAAAALYGFDMPPLSDTFFSAGSPATLARVVATILRRVASDSRQVQVTCRGGDLDVIVDVTDDTVLTEEEVSTLFDPGAVTLPDGDDRALAIAKESTLAMGGSLTVSSSPERGTVVTLRLPRVWPE